MSSRALHTKIDYDQFFQRWRWVAWLGDAASPTARRHGFERTAEEAERAAARCFEGPEYHDLRA